MYYGFQTLIQLQIMHLVYIGKKFYAFPQFTLKWAALAKVQKDQLTGS